MRLLSVPHSGTRFMVDVLQNAGYNSTHAFWGNGDFIQTHFDGRGDNPIIYRENGLVIIPMREKEEVKASWQRRGKSMAELERMWTELEGFVDWYPHHIYFVHIDDENRREDEIQALSEKLGSHLIADFSVKVGQGN